MRFHLPSFLIGYAAGATTAVFWSRLRPLALELATAAYRTFDIVTARVVARREDFEDLLAEARARARDHFRKSPEAVATN